MRRRCPSSPVLTVIAALILALAVAAAAAGNRIATAQDGDASTADAEATRPPVIQPITEGWSLLANTGPATSPAELLAPLDGLVAAAFTFDATRDHFYTYRPGAPHQTDLTWVEAGQALWIFVPAGRLGGDVAFFELPASARDRPTTLEPGFTLVGWTGTDGRRASLATDGLPVRRVYQWDSASQRYRVWDTRVPGEVQDDFPLEYGAGLWVDLRGSAPVVWYQR